MKTLLLAPQPYFSNRGTPMNVRAMLSILTGSGVVVDLLTYPVGEDTPMDGLSIHRVRKPPLIKKVAIGPSFAKIPLDAEMTLAAYRLASRGGYRMIHAIEEAVYIGILLKKRFGLPLIYDMDSSMKDQLVNYGFARGKLTKKILTSLERLAVRGSDGVITVCRALTDSVNEMAPGKPVFQIEDIPIETDMAEIPPDAAALELRMSGKKVMLYTGNFEPYQGISLLVEALPAVAVVHPQALLVLVGGSGKHLDRIAGEIRARGVDGQVLLIEPRPPSQMWWFMDRAYALLSPRVQGTNTPLKIYTYMKSGRPVVATRMPTHTQVLQDDWAELVEATPRAMADGLIGLLAHPERAKELGERARAVVEEKYSREMFRTKLMRAYRIIGGYRFPGYEPGL